MDLMGFNSRGREITNSVGLTDNLTNTPGGMLERLVYLPNNLKCKRLLGV